MDGQEWLRQLLGNTEPVSPESQAMHRFKITKGGEDVAEQEGGEEIFAPEQQEDYRGGDRGC